MTNGYRARITVSAKRENGKYCLSSELKRLSISSILSHLCMHGDKWALLTSQAGLLVFSPWPYSRGASALG